MLKNTRIIEAKRGSKWEETFRQEDSYEITRHLAQDLAAKYIGKASFIRRIVRRNNYDGTQTYTVTYANDTRAIYIVDIY